MNPAVVDVSSFFPCYNDEPSIGLMVETALATIDRCGIDGEVIVVNDGSSDGSAKVVHDIVVEDPRVSLVQHEHNRGYGGALLSGFAASRRQWVFYTDGDGQFDPAELELLVRAARDDVDVVQGYKLRRADSLLRRVIGRVYHRFVAFMFGLKIRDTDCDFRLIRRSTLDRITLEHSTGVVCVEMVRKLQDAGAVFVEVPVHHYPRRHGKSEFFRVPSVLKSLRDLSVLWVRQVVLKRGVKAAPARIDRSA